MKEEMTFVSKCGVNIHYYLYKPFIQMRYRGLIQIHHGMAEHSLRYDHFARYLSNHGYIVAVCDHIGHGKSLIQGQLGYFGEQDGWETLVYDTHRLNQIMHREYPDVPHLIFGHSMGSFVLRDYISRFGDYIDGVILSGTGIQDKLLGFNKSFLDLLMVVKGKLFRSTLVNQMSFGSYNKKFKPNRTEFDWLSRDENEVDKYIQDDLCGFVMCLKAYRDLLDGFTNLKTMSKVKRISKHLPILFVSGSDDPVSHSGEDIHQLYKQYKNIGLDNVEMKLYENARHELLNETNKEEVYQDILTWLEKTVGYE